MLFDRLVVILQNIPSFWKYLAVLIIGASPFLEVRGAIIIAFGLGLDPFLSLLLGLLGNIIAIPLIFFFLDMAGVNKIAHRLFGKRAMKKIEKNREKFHVYEELALLAFVAIPLPMTGAWMGTFIAHILGLNRRRSFIVISAGVAIASLIVFLGTYGVYSLL